MGTRRGQFTFTPMGVNSTSLGSPHALRADMGARVTRQTKSRKIPTLKNYTFLFCGQTGSRPGTTASCRASRTRRHAAASTPLSTSRYGQYCSSEARPGMGGTLVILFAILDCVGSSPCTEAPHGGGRADVRTCGRADMQMGHRESKCPPLTFRSFIEMDTPPRPLSAPWSAASPDGAFMLRRSTSKENAWVLAVWCTSHVARRLNLPRWGSIRLRSPARPHARRTPMGAIR